MYMFIYLFISFSPWNICLQIHSRCTNLVYKTMTYYFTWQHTIKIKYKDHASINVNKKVNCKPLNCNNRYEIWQFACMLNVLILYIINLFKYKTIVRLLEGVVNSLYTKTCQVFFVLRDIAVVFIPSQFFCTIHVLTKIVF